MDTHRLWEVLNMETVPIVLTSSLDRLYSQFPIVIVQSWDEVFAQDALEKFKKDIISKWGTDPFKSTKKKLSVKYWRELVDSYLQISIAKTHQI